MYLSSMNKMTRKGSILIEALAAVVIISISLTLIMQSFAGNFRATVLHQDYAKALVLLENRLDQSAVVTAADLVANPDAHCPEPMERFNCKAKLSDLNDATFEGLKRLDMTVAWPSGKKDKELSVTTFLKTEDVKQETKSVFYN